MIVSALSLFKKIDITRPLDVQEGERWSSSRFLVTEVTFSGHRTEDGVVRVFARFYRPPTQEKTPAILLLPDLFSSREEGEELAEYFVKKGYCVLVPDYQGATGENGEEKRTVYPDSLAFANADRADLYHLKEGAEKTCWFEWTYVSLYALEYLKSRPDVGEIGAVGIRIGGEILWKTMLSSDLKCGVPVNAAGWQAYFDYDKFADNAERHMSDERHGYIAGIESQSYAPFIQCPVLMLCSMRDYSFDYDRAYDTFSRIAEKDGSAIVYSPDSGPCIGPNALKDMDLFLERNLKGREIYIPQGVDLKFRTENDELFVDLETDTGGIVEEVGVFYAETGAESESAFREWQSVLKTDGRNLKNGRVSCPITPFAGANYAFAYAYARYINGFRVASKIVAKKLDAKIDGAIKSRVVYSGGEVDCFSVLDYRAFADGGIFLESEAVPKRVEGFGKITGAYSPGGIRTYKIGSPRYVANDGAMLEFDAYAPQATALRVHIEVAVKGDKFKNYSATVDVRGGGKWKRTIVKATDLKEDETGEPLKSFCDGIALAFESDAECAVTNILWL